MAGVSSKSLAAALESLEPKLATASIALAKDLFSILELLDSNAGLRRALTDPSRESADKAALVAKLLAGKVGARKHRTCSWNWLPHDGARHVTLAMH